MTEPANKICGVFFLLFLPIYILPGAIARYSSSKRGASRQLDGSMCLARFLSRWQEGVGVDPTLESFAFGDLCLVRREPNLWDF